MFIGEFGYATERTQHSYIKTIVAAVKEAVSNCEDNAKKKIIRCKG